MHINGKQGKVIKKKVGEGLREKGPLSIGGEVAD